MIEKAGIAGMSTDESDYEEQNGAIVKVFKIRTSVYRAPTFTSYLRAFDKTAVILRVLVPDARGALPRRRISPTPDTERTLRESALLDISPGRYVPDLPKNAYYPPWISVFTAQGFDIAHTDEEYNFNHSIALFE